MSLNHVIDLSAAEEIYKSHGCHSARPFFSVFQGSHGAEGAYVYYGEARWCPAWHRGRNHQKIRAERLQIGGHQIHAGEVSRYHVSGTMPMGLLYNC